jgi:hypothetical protein
MSCASSPNLVWVELLPEARTLLRETLGELKFSNKTLNDDQICHHVTLFYKPNAYDMQKLPREGTKCKISCIRRCWSDSFGVEAMEVDLITVLGSKVFCNNNYPHITLSTEGVPPVKSNELLEKRKTISDFQFQNVALDIFGEVKYIQKY